MANFSSKEIERQQNLIKILFSDKTKYADAIKLVKKDNSYMPIKLKKKLKKKNYILYTKKF